MKDQTLKQIDALIDALAEKVEKLHKSAAPEKQESLAPALAGLPVLKNAVADGKPIFGLEPWHVLRDDALLKNAGEMLLRLEDADGKPLPPYPFIMALYENDLAPALDTILLLCALRQFPATEEQQISVNISAASLRDPFFVKTALENLSAVGFKGEERLILEIHESAGAFMSQDILRLFRQFKIMFALDDVGLTIHDVFRLSEFEDMVDFIKLDKKSVWAEADDPFSLKKAMGLITAIFPNPVIVAEGVKDIAHARTLAENYPEIAYAQGLHLPDRATFKAGWGK